MTLYSDENLLLKGASSNDLANKYINEDTFKFSQADGANSNKLFSTRYKIAASIKQERLKPYLNSAVQYMSSDERKYWQSLFSELFIAELYQYNFHVALNRKQLLKAAEDNLCYYKSQLKHLESFEGAIITPSEPALLWKNNEGCLFNNIKTEGYYSPAKWCQDVLGKITTAWNAFLRDCLDELNWYRLYWVWAGGAGGFLGSILDLESAQKWHSHDSASARLESPDVLCGYASWSLYATRLSLHLALTAKHVIPNPFMSDVEKDVAWTTRFMTQLEQRYQRVGNDIAWGYVNYASLYWYTNALSPTLGAFGGFLNVALMSWDCMMAGINLKLGSNRFNAAKASILAKLEILNNDENAMDPNTKDRAIVALKQSLQILEINWKYDKNELIFTLCLAIAFIPAMALMFMPMFPIYFPALVIGGALMSQLVFVGCLASVLLTAYETYYCANLAIDKSIELMNGAIEKMKLLDMAHNQLLAIEEPLTPEESNRARQHHLEHKRLLVEIKHFELDQKYQRIKMSHSIMVQFAFPAVVFGCLFVSLTPAIIIIASALVVALVTKLMVDANKPKEVDEFANNKEEGFTALNLTEDEYYTPKQAFFDAPPADNNSGLGTYGLFSTNHQFVPSNTCSNLRPAM